MGEALAPYQLAALVARIRSGYYVALLVQASIIALVLTVIKRVVKGCKIKVCFAARLNTAAVWVMLGSSQMVFLTKACFVVVRV